MEKRTLIAFLLTIVVWGIWFLVLKPDATKPNGSGTTGKGTEQVQKETVGKQTTKKDDVKTESTPVKPDARPVKIVKSDKTEEKVYDVSTEKFNIQLSNRGGAIKSLRLKERKNPEGGDLEVIVSKSPYQAKNIIDFPVHFSENEFMNGSELEDAVWRSEKRPDGSVHFYTEVIIDGNPVQVHKTYTFNDKGDDFHLEYKIVNKGKKELSLKERKIIFSPSDMLGPTIDYDNTYNRIQGICSVNKNYEQLAKGSGFFSKEGILKKVPGEANWVGLMSRYLLLIMLPEKFSGSEVISDNRNNTGFRTGMAIAPENIGADSQMVKGFRIYLGEKDKDKLRKVSEDIVDAADVSKWIEPIRYFVMWSLLGLKGMVGNLGWALVIFSILTKIAFMPLTKKSTDSMRKMQALTPKINEIKAKYKDKPDVIQQETMKLYKENKVNPLGGCLPVILQMPFFFGLYSALVNSIDLWNAPFIFWIRDLSMPDTVMHFSGFNVNILPVIMTATTYIQQKMTSVEGGQQQKIMMMMMPAVFIFIFWSMPSGLVLYWTLQNGLQIAHQFYATHRDNMKNGKK